MGYQQPVVPGGGSSALDKLDATAAPTVNDDVSLGYSIGSRWYDLTHDEYYVALDVTDGAAVWVLSSGNTAAEIVNTPAGNVAAINVQTAINELDSEKEPLLSGAATKTPPVDADSVHITDSAASNVSKRVTWANIKATLKTYMDGLYFRVGTDTADSVPDGSTNKAYTATEKTKLAGISTAADVTETVIHAATGKTTPVDADEVGLIDSAASNVLKKLTWANLKAALKTYFDTLYGSVTAKTFTATYDLTTASGNQTIAHGLGRTPVLVMIDAFRVAAVNELSGSSGSYDGTTNACAYFYIRTSGQTNNVNAAIVYINQWNGSGDDTQIGTATVNGTNIIIAWTKTGSTISGSVSMKITVL